MTSSEARRYDAVVIGGGHNGLVSAAVLAKSGLRHVGTEVKQWDEPIPGWEHGEVFYEITRDEWAASPA